MDYSRFLNHISSARTVSPWSIGLHIAQSAEPIIDMSIGVPNSEMYPFESITVKLRDGHQINIEDDLLQYALGYGSSRGYPKLVDLLFDYQMRLHNPPMSGKWTTVMTNGVQDGICKAFEMTLNIGDYLIAEKYIYHGTLAILKTFSVKHLEVESDKDGMISESLRDVLSRWNPDEMRNSNNSVPKVLYIIPNGSNPTGESMSAERKKEIYKIAQEYNLIIFEDDPYYFLSYGKEKVPSFLSMDVDGRVLRFDSFSKILASGLRLGYVTGSDALIQRLLLHIEVSQMHCSNESQQNEWEKKTLFTSVMTAAIKLYLKIFLILLHETLNIWGYDQFIAHTDKVARFYELRRDKMLKYFNKWLSGLAECNVPVAGMFLWIRVLGLKDTTNLVNNCLFLNRVAFLSGKTCTFDGTDSPYLRASFSVASDEDMDKGFEILAKCILEELGACNGLVPCLSAKVAPKSQGN